MDNRDKFIFENTHLDRKQDESGPMIIMTSVFILWGFLTAMNGNFSSKLQEILSLTKTQESLLSFVFFAWYFVTGLLFYLVSRYLFDPIAKFGYKRLVILGLLITASGCFLFYPATELSESPAYTLDTKFFFFLSTIVVLATGFAILQITANPYVILMGPDRSAASRLNLSQAFNAFGAYLAPIITTLLFFESDKEVSTDSIKMIYITLGTVVLILAFLFYNAVLPNIKPKNNWDLTDKAIKNEKGLIFGAIAIFLYVGGEVAIGSHLEDYLKLDSIKGLDTVTAKKYVSLYWGGAMAGRFAGALFLSRIEQRSRNGIILLLILLAYLLGYSSTTDSQLSLIFTLLFIVNLVGFRIGQKRSARTLGVFAIMILICICISLLTEENIAMWSLLIIGMFNSIMFPNIFRTALKNLKQKTSSGSALLIMSIVGGAFIPALQDLAIDKLNISLKISFIVPALCYIYIATYAFKKHTQ